MEAHNITPALDWLGSQEWVYNWGYDRPRGWKDGSVIIFEYHGGSVRFVHLAARAGVPWAQVTCGIILREV
jgi:uncharacterized membrane protein